MPDRETERVTSPTSKLSPYRTKTQWWGCDRKGPNGVYNGADVHTEKFEWNLHS